MMPSTGNHIQYDRIYEVAREEALKGLREGGIPVGAALTLGEQIIGTGHNLRIQAGDPTAHAEIECLRDAGRLSGYEGTTLYTTATPCYLCAGAILLFGIPRVVIGQTTTYNGEGSLELLKSREVEVTDLDDTQSSEMLDNFFEEHPKLWMEDTGR